MTRVESTRVAESHELADIEERKLFDDLPEDLSFEFSMK